MCDCIFCKIVNGEIPSMKIYENSDILVILDTAKDVNGHMLAIPKKHSKSILDCDEETLCKLFNAVKLVSEHCVKDCGYDGVNLLNASGESAGQSVLHFHIHIIPRRNDDGIDAWPKFNGATLSNEMAFKKLRMY